MITDRAQVNKTLAIQLIAFTEVALLFAYDGVNVHKTLEFLQQ